VAEAQDSVFTPKMSKLYLIITQGAIANPRKSGKKDRLSSTLWHIPKDLARLTEGVESLYYCTENIYAILLSALAGEKANKKNPDRSRNVIENKRRRNGRTAHLHDVHRNS